MLFRIDYEHFLSHMIDHFTRNEILQMLYIVISANMPIGSRSVTNISKFSEFYPTTEDIQTLISTGDEKLFKKIYIDKLHEDTSTRIDIYNTFVTPVDHHTNICILCRENENLYIDAIVEYLKTEYTVDCVDLNKLFTDGHSGELYINFDKVHDKMVGVRRIAAKMNYEMLERTPDGRREIMSRMSKKDKIKKLREMDISVNKNDDIDTLLKDEWVNNIEY